MSDEAAKEETPEEKASKTSDLFFQQYTKSITVMAERIYIQNVDVLEGDSDAEEKRIAVNSYRAALNFQKACFGCADMMRDGINELIEKVFAKITENAAQTKKD